MYYGKKENKTTTTDHNNGWQLRQKWHKNVIAMRVASTSARNPSLIHLHIVETKKWESVGETRRGIERNGGEAKGAPVLLTPSGGGGRA